MSDGSLDRKNLRDVLYKKGRNRALIEQILHPKILQKMQAMMDDCDAGVLVVVIPLLVEKELFGSKVKTMIGIGINIKLNEKESWWGDLSKYGFQNQRNEFISEITNEIIKISIEKPMNWADKWRDSCVHMNKKIEIHGKNKITQNVIFKDIDKDGNAIIETDNGLEIFKSGQISVKGIY